MSRIKWVVRGFLSVLVNMIIDITGNRGLNIYLSLVNKIPTLRFKLFRKIRNFLIFLPKARVATHQIKANPVGFNYSTNLKDDFRYDCRSSFLEYELVSRRFFYLEATSAGSILDIGAYSGIYSITAALANEESSIYAFEPNPEILELSRINFELNEVTNRISLMPIALGDVKGTANLYFNPSDWESATASLNINSGKHIEVTVSTIDDILAGSPIDLIKIDVEGFESTVFVGGEKSLREFCPIILSEILSPKDLQSQLNVLTKYGYAFPVQISENPDSTDFRNYVWFTEKKRERVMSNLKLARSDSAL